ncbi:MAG: CatA-like O-acetyltransferase [Bacteroidales bacterium]|nr:CatA-like O-acetyltransferase [Bacteroidales bacterium]
MYEIDPEQTQRAESYKEFVISPMPMVTIFKTIDITKMIKFCNRKGYKYNMVFCYCIGQASKKMPELLYQMKDKTMLKFDKFAIDVIVNNKNGQLGYCDVPVIDELEKIKRPYLESTAAVSERSKNKYITDASIICTSAIVKYDIDGVVNQYHPIYDHPYLAWGKFTKHWFRTHLKLSFQFHHIIIDAGDACRYIEEIQKVINQL